MNQLSSPILIHCATSNPGKLREFQLVAKDHNMLSRVRIIPLPTLGQITPPDETGKTIEENAILKGEYYSAKAPGLMLAEDSGLEVLALEREPGVFSARFGGPRTNDELNNRLLLEKLQGIEDRSARFVCVIALAEKGKLLHMVRGIVDGYVLDRPRGTNGFGYDPLFFYPPLNCSFAELSPERKFQVSHRGIAVNALMSFLEEHYLQLSAPPGH
jgi:XTP/dITP diphosphohydrolase